jgi:hypothetical protein
MGNTVGPNGFSIVAAQNLADLKGRVPLLYAELMTAPSKK